MSQPTLESVTFDVEGMTCASCALRIERVLGKQEGVASAVVNYAGHEARAEVEPGADVEALMAAVAKIGYSIEEINEGDDRTSVTERYAAEVHVQRRNFIGAASLTAPVFLLDKLRRTVKIPRPRIIPQSLPLLQHVINRSFHQRT